MKKFLAIFIAMVLIGCTKSDNTKENQNNNAKQSSDSGELIEKNLTADSKPSANDNINVPAKSDEDSDNGVYVEMETSKGMILLRLFYKQVPQSLQQYMELAYKTAAKGLYLCWFSFLHRPHYLNLHQIWSGH